MTVRAGDEDSRVPCDACGTPVDPVRAPYVAVIDARFRYYCSPECRERRRPAAPAGEPVVPRDAPRPSLVEVAGMLGLHHSSLNPELVHAPHAEAGPLRRRDGYERSRDRIVPGLALGAAGLALVLAQLAPLPLRLPVVVTLAAIVLGTAVREIVLRQRAHATLGSLAGGVLGVAAALLVGSLALRQDANRARDLAEAAVLAALVPAVAWWSRERRRAVLERLDEFRMGLARTATVLRGEGTEKVESSRLRAGEEVRVCAGEVVPVDGVVHTGSARVLLFAGATEPRPRSAGDAVLAGARLVEGELHLLATRSGDDVAWARLSRSIDEGSERPRVVRWAVRQAELLPPLAVVVAVGAALAQRYLLGGDGTRAAAWVLSLVPCAMAAASGVEAPFAEALAGAARRGIVFRDAAGVEAAAQVGTVALCMSGTVTAGRLALAEIVQLGRRGEDELLALAAAAAEISAHDPLALALREAVARRGLRLESVRRPVSVPGQGITAMSPSGEGIAVGNRRLLLSEGIAVAPGEDVARSIEAAGRTALFVAVAGRIEGVLGFEDPVRDEARSAVQAMIDTGFDVALLGGASRGTMEAIGALLDVTNLRPEVLPDERPAVVRALAEMGSGVAVIGHAARDSTSLAAADVAISLEAAGGAGGDTAVALASDDLRDAAAALRLASRARERSVGVLGVRLGGTALGALALALAPSLGALAVCGVLAAVLAAEALVLRQGDAAWRMED